MMSSRISLSSHASTAPVMPNFVPTSAPAASTSEGIIGPLFNQDPLFEVFSTPVSSGTEARIPLYMRKNPVGLSNVTPPSQISPGQNMANFGYGFQPGTNGTGGEALTNAQLYSWAPTGGSPQQQQLAISQSSSASILSSEQSSKMITPPSVASHPFMPRSSTVGNGMSDAMGQMGLHQQPPTHDGNVPGLGDMTSANALFKPIPHVSNISSPGHTPTPPHLAGGMNGLPGGVSAPPFIPGNVTRRRINQSSPIVGGVGVSVDGSGIPPVNSQPGSMVYQESGGTTYFYNAEEASYYHPAPVVETAYVYPGPPSSVVHVKPKGGGVASYFISDELRQELVQRHALTVVTIDPEHFPELPLEVDTYHNLFPLEPIPKTSMVERPGYFSYVSSAFRATNVKDGLAYCLRRIHGFRLTNTKCMAMVEMWKKSVNHSNIVQLREVFTTKAFGGEHSLVFAYDFHAGAETLKSRHFSGVSRLNGLHRTPFAHDDTPNKIKGRPKTGMGAGTLLPEPLIWCYVVQLCSALRAIHSAGLAARTLDPSKVLVVGKSKLLLNCCGILDVLTHDHSQQSSIAMIQHYQQDDLTSLGRLVLALSCNSLLVVQRDQLGASIDLVARHYSGDLKNLILYLLMPQQRPRSVNDIMPMIGARFFSQLDAAQTKIDILENELAKELENGRLFRLLCKLNTINERPEFQLDPQWSETGDRYLLKLFRDYLFHQVAEDGRPWMDIAHVVQTLNKLDQGSPEKISLMSRDERNILIVSYGDLKRCLESSFHEILMASAAIH